MEASACNRGTRAVTICQHSRHETSHVAALSPCVVNCNFTAAHVHSYKYGNTTAHAAKESGGESRKSNLYETNDRAPSSNRSIDVGCFLVAGSISLQEYRHIRFVSLFEERVDPRDCVRSWGSRTVTRDEMQTHLLVNKRRLKETERKRDIERKPPRFTKEKSSSWYVK